MGDMDWVNDGGHGEWFLARERLSKADAERVVRWAEGIVNGDALSSQLGIRLPHYGGPTRYLRLTGEVQYR